MYTPLGFFYNAIVSSVSAESPDETGVPPALQLNASPTPGIAGSGNIITITTGGQIAINGVTLGGASVTELYYINHTAYQMNSLNNWYGPITASSTGVSVANPIPPSLVHYGSTAPATITTVSGAVSPLGWTVGFFDDFTSWTPSTTSDSASTDATNNWYCLVDNNKFLANPGSEQQFYCNLYRTPACNPFSQSGSILTITASVPTAPQLASIQACVGYNAANYSVVGGPYISGALHSGQFYAATYGYYEINCTQPAGAGAWSKFWMPTGIAGEMDYMEQSGSTAGTQIGCGVHYTGSDGIAGANQYQTSAVPDATTAFHTYGGLWTPNYVAFYIDGVLKFSASPAYVGALGGANTKFAVNLGLGNGTGDGSASAGTLPKSMQIDWIRVSVIGAL